MTAERDERRLAAILAADIVGYTRLMGADESGTFARLEALRSELVEPKIASYGGRIFKLMGDGMLAEFPSVVDAVQCAVVVQGARSPGIALRPRQWGPSGPAGRPARPRRRGPLGPLP